MRAVLIWLVMLSLAAWALWQLQVAEPSISPVWMGLLLLVLGLIGGLRLATDSATRFVGDIVRLNKYLAEQNHDLSEMNQVLLKKVLREEETDDT